MNIKQFKNPDCEYRGAPFWAWNGKLEPEELRRQIRLMKQMGLGGFFMHSRVGLDTPYLSKEWFECINSCADEAKKLNMNAWLYDEDRWPSGAAGGLVTKNPKYRAKILIMRMIRDKAKIKWQKNDIAAFIGKVDLDNIVIKDVKRIPTGKKIQNIGSDEMILIFSSGLERQTDWYNGYTYLDTKNPEAVREFISVTHQQYKKNSGQYFGSSVPGIFTDEPFYGSQYSQFVHYTWPPTAEGNIFISWTDKLPEVFKKKYGYDILDHLPEIYFDIQGQKVSKARHNYYDCLTYLFVNAFAKQIGRWCEQNKILFTGHILMEDTLSMQCRVVGSALRFYEYMQAPGMDLLMEHWRIFNTAKQVSSVARQMGKKWRLTETYGCTGWDFPFAAHKALGDWQAALGINLRCQHLSFYTMLGEAKRDYPASIFYQSPWYQQYPLVEDYFARINSIMTNGKEARDLLVIYPIESMWSISKMPKHPLNKDKYGEQHENVKKYDEMFDSLCDTLLCHHIDFDYGDEEMMSRMVKITKKLNKPVIRLGEAEYKAVLVPPLITIRKSTLQLLEEFKRLGGEVVFVLSVPEYVDAEISSEAKEFASRCPSVSSFESAVNALKQTCQRISIADGEGKEIKPVLYLLREDKQAFYLFVCNTGMDWQENKQTGSKKHPLVIERTLAFDDVIIKGIPEWQYQPIELDPRTGDAYLTDSIKTQQGYQIKTSLGPIASRLFLIPKTESSLKTYPIKDKRKKLTEISRNRIEQDAWDVLLSESNVCVLDRPFYKIGNGEWKQDEILRVDRAVRKHLGIKPRGGDMVQPWARERNTNPKTVTISLKYLLCIESIPSGEASIAIEKPELYRICINGNEILPDMESGWWVDKSLRTIRFSPSILVKGKNEIVLECQYNENHPGLEIIYVLGNFAVKVQATETSLNKWVNTLKIGDWCEQGLPFYSGNVGYACNIKPGLRENQRFIINIPNYRGVGIRILVDGKEAGIIGWLPNEVDITEYIKGKQEVNLTIEVLGHRRNSHGPFHHIEKWPLWTGPGQFITEGREWFDGYNLVPCGLLSPPEIVILEECDKL